MDAKALDKSNIVTVTPSLTPRDRPYKDPGRSTGHSERSKLVNARVGSWKAAQNNYHIYTCLVLILQGAILYFRVAFRNLGWQIPISWSDPKNKGTQTILKHVYIS